MPTDFKTTLPSDLLVELGLTINCWRAHAKVAARRYPEQQDVILGPGTTEASRRRARRKYWVLTKRQAIKARREAAVETFALREEIERRCGILLPLGFLLDE